MSLTVASFAVIDDSLYGNISTESPVHNISLN